MSLMIAVDGGGSGCRVLVADATGQILARATGGPANIATDPEGALRAILACSETAVRSACGSAALSELRHAYAGLGLAGANAKGASERLAAALPFARCRIETDAITAARGALGEADGILAAIGTGSVFVRQRAGQLQQFGGWGIVLGDEGSGARLGQAILIQAMRAAESFRPMTPYLASVLQRHDGPEGVIAFSLTARPADLAKFAPEILASSDPAAAEVWSESVSNIAEILRALGCGAELPASFNGGLGAAYSRALSDLPQRPALGSSLDGALLLARGLA
ncbi:BadF/BadG/BcrA/BcrD ATPase family protein [Xinfangfangia sp. CPCC 101601]|uniref:BadF/BadG/BcrA/BcrD ATPase family protein n=1 Tax=Pseudogemmobacter lacusdianii TaxID=3069608 RepID=A0ABU0VUE2_9RHOB|nr:BadF/BadG/BcrA/BcrD ATPase family protein [Xinfangfangia sp. CPCC 101601]MDQ2065273.1 BadF/BadG/BcrA/BcrD ATPase family protein [Xinfangfangia sp. CPCC 101601]